MTDSNQPHSSTDPTADISRASAESPNAASCVFFTGRQPARPRPNPKTTLVADGSTFGVPADPSPLRIDLRQVDADRLHGSSSTSLGARRPQGSLEAADGPFRLANGLSAPGQIGWTETVAKVRADWVRQAGEGRIQALSAEKMGFALNRLASFGDALRLDVLADLTDSDVEDWIHARLPRTHRRGRKRESHAEPSLNTKHARRGLVRQFSRTCRTLGLDDRWLGEDVRLPSRSARKVSALTDDELISCHRTAASTNDATLLPASLALALTGSSTAEMGNARLEDLRLDKSLIWVHGGNQRTFARWLPLEDWMCEALAARTEVVRGLRPSEGEQAHLVYTGKADNTYNGKQSAVCMNLRRILNLAGITRPDARPASFVETVAEQTFADTGRIEAVAARLGLVSLDRAAHLASYSWIAPHLTAGPEGF